MKNSLLDLHNHLFAQLERLSDEELKDNELKQEIERSRAVSDISKTITENARLALKAAELRFETQGVVDSHVLRLGE